MFTQLPKTVGLREVLFFKILNEEPKNLIKKINLPSPPTGSVRPTANK